MLGELSVVSRLASDSNVTLPTPGTCVGNIYHVLAWLGYEIIDKYTKMITVLLSRKLRSRLARDPVTERRYLPLELAVLARPIEYVFLVFGLYTVSGSGSLCRPAYWVGAVDVMRIWDLQPCLILQMYEFAYEQCDEWLIVVID